VPAIDTLPLLLAADFWQVVFGLIVFILYSIGQWLNAKEQAKKDPAKPRRPRPPQRPARQEFEGQGLEEQEPEMLVVGRGNQEDALRDEVKDFLRRAEGKPPRQKRQARPKPRLSESAQPATSLRREGVAEHVASHLSSQQMIEHAERLGDEVGLADERLESRLHPKIRPSVGESQARDEACRDAKKGAKRSQRGHRTAVQAGRHAADRHRPGNLATP